MDYQKQIDSTIEETWNHSDATNLIHELWPCTDWRELKRYHHTG